MYLYVLDYTDESNGLYVYKIDENEDPEWYISEHTSHWLSDVEWLTSKKLNVQILCK